MSGSAPELSIVIPAYEEAERLGPTLERVVGWIGSRARSAEVVVVDDGSRDATSRVAARFEDRGVRTERFEANRGKGAALRRGVALSRGRHLVLSDADLSTPIEEIDRLEPRLGEVDIVLGSRAVAGARLTRRQPRHRELAGQAFNLAIRLLGVRGIRDTQCGFKLLRGDEGRALFADLTVDRFAYDVELVWLARRRGLRVEEVGVEWRNDPATRVRWLRDGVAMLLDVVRFRWRHRGRSGARE